MNLTTNTDYQALLDRISQTYNDARHQTSRSINADILKTYWQIGHDIVEYE